MNIMLEKRGRWLPVLALLFCFFIGNAKKTLTYDEKLTNAINALDWFTLDSLYKAVPKDSIEPFNDIYSRCLIGNRFNRPDVSLPAFSELFNTEFKKHSLENLLTFAKMYSTDLSQVGENQKAVSMLTAFLDSTKNELGERAIMIEQLINRYKGLSSFSPYDISFEAENGVIPFHIDTIGEKENVMIYLDDSYINGRKANITFDTGAPVNLISYSLAKEFQLIPIDGEVTLNGIGKQEAVFTVAKELKIGNIILHDVPFCVMDIKTNSEEADQLAKFFNLIVGSELMLHLKDFTIDFTKNEMFVPAKAPQKSDVKSNFCFSPMMNLLAKGSIHNDQMEMVIDTGNGGNGILDENFFKANKKFVKSTGKLETVRNGGIGGVHIAQCYQVPDMKLELGGTSVNVPMMQVFIKDAPYDHECNLGLRALMLFNRIRFNMVDFVITTE
ncbi:MAG: retropepsin-like domain-containing protein [Muribaculaceae bacterium]|nr:retropepsin-like domain-containing protein [Muribaculaceae bacterium]